MTLDDRIAAGDREAIYDAIAEAREELDDVRRGLAELLAEDRDTLDRLKAVRQGWWINGEPPIVRPRRRKKQETAGTAASGKERQRSRITRSESASHGR